MKMVVVVNKYQTRVFADGELVMFFNYASVAEGLHAANLYKAEKQFLSKGGDHEAVMALTEDKHGYRVWKAHTGNTKRRKHLWGCIKDFIRGNSKRGKAVGEMGEESGGEGKTTAV